MNPWDQLLHVLRIWEWNYYAWQQVVFPHLTFGDKTRLVDQSRLRVQFWWYLSYGISPERPAELD